MKYIYSFTLAILLSSCSAQANLATAMRDVVVGKVTELKEAAAADANMWKDEADKRKNKKIDKCLAVDGVVGALEIAQNIKNPLLKCDSLFEIINHQVSRCVDEDDIKTYSDILSNNILLLDSKGDAADLLIKKMELLKDYGYKRCIADDVNILEEICSEFTDENEYEKTFNLIKVAKFKYAFDQTKAEQIIKSCKYDIDLIINSVCKVNLEIEVLDYYLSGSQEIEFAKNQISKIETKFEGLKACADKDLLMRKLSKIKRVNKSLLME